MIFSVLKRRSLFYYNCQIRTPLLKLKERDIRHFDLRADYNQELLLKDYDPDEMDKIFKMELLADHVHKDDEE